MSMTHNRYPRLAKALGVLGLSAFYATAVGLIELLVAVGVVLVIAGALVYAGIKAKAVAKAIGERYAQRIQKDAEDEAEKALPSLVITNTNVIKRRFYLWLSHQPTNGPTRVQWSTRPTGPWETILEGQFDAEGQCLATNMIQPAAESLFFRVIQP